MSSMGASCLDLSNAKDADKCFAHWLCSTKGTARQCSERLEVNVQHPASERASMRVEHGAHRQMPLMRKLLNCFQLANQDTGAKGAVQAGAVKGDVVTHCLPPTASNLQA